MAGGASGADPRDATIEIDGSSRDEGAMGGLLQSRGPSLLAPSGSTGTTAVREQLTAVKKELDFIAQSMKGPGGKVAAIDLVAVQRMMGHLEVDREKLTEKCQRMAEKQKALEDTNAHLETELYATQRQLEEAQRMLRHQAIDAEVKSGGGFKADPLPEAPAVEGDAVMHEAMEALKMNYPGLDRQAGKLDLVRALRICKDELSTEKDRCEKLEKKLLRAVQRVHLLEDAAERQRQEIAAIRAKKQQKIAASPELAGKTKMLSNLSHTFPVHRTVKDEPSPFSEGVLQMSQSSTLLLPEGDQEQSLSRTESAPTKLPKMRGRFVPV